MNAVNELSKGYMPKENLDVSKKISEGDMFDIARKIFGIEKQPRLEKFKKFVQACQKAAEEREQGKKEYAAPECQCRKPAEAGRNCTSAAGTDRGRFSSDDQSTVTSSATAGSSGAPSAPG